MARFCGARSCPITVHTYVHTYTGKYYTYKHLKLVRAVAIDGSQQVMETIVQMDDRVKIVYNHSLDTNIRTHNNVPIKIDNTITRYTVDMWSVCGCDPYVYIVCMYIHMYVCMYVLLIRENLRDIF